MKLKLTTIVLSFSALAVLLMTASFHAPSSLNFRGLQQSLGVENLNLSNSSFPKTFKIAGISGLVQSIVAASNFSNSSFDVLTINSFDESISEDGIVYQGQVSITNDQNITLNGLVSGVYNPDNNTMVFSSAPYTVSTEDSSNSSNSSNSSSPSNSSNLTSDGYTILDPAEAQNNSDIVAAFNWGEQSIINAAQQKNKIPYSQYNSSQWNSVAYKNWTNGVTYQFSADVVGANYVHVLTKFNVTYNNVSGSYRLKDYYYHATNITLADLAASNNNTNATNNATNSSGLASDNSTNSSSDSNSTVVPSDNSTDVSGSNSTDVVIADNSTNSSLPVDNSTTVISDNSTSADNSSNSSNASNSSAPIANATNNTVVIPAGYTAIDNSTIAQNLPAYKALLWASQAIVAKAINQSKLPAGSPNYTITSVPSAIYKNQSSGVWYTFRIELENALSYLVDANVTVFYRNANQSYALNGYGYYTSNYRPSAIVRPAANSTAPVVYITNSSSIASPSNASASNVSASNANASSVTAPVDIASAEAPANNVPIVDAAPAGSR